MERQVKISQEELFKIAALDDIFYCHHFFPKTFRQRSPDFHRDFWAAFNDEEYDYFAAEMFRGSAKTTLTRVGISKRIAYGISRNVLAVSISESMAIHTITWLRRQMETNTNWVQTFGLVKGAKWSDNWIEIHNTLLQTTTNIVAKGMTSSVRGLNLDDWRPDLIMCDDICNEENTGTEDQRIKTKELFFGALAPSLAPKSEAPLRKMMLLQTGLHSDDVINLAHKDPVFRTVRYPKIVEENGVERSTWEERFPTAECIKEKEDYIRRNQFHIWLREFGCKIVSRETAPLKTDWLREFTTTPTDLRFYIGIDPASSKKKTAHKNAMGVIGVRPKTGDVYLMDYFAQKGKNPEEVWIWLLSKYRIYRPRETGVETIAYQEMLAWYFEQKMQETQTYFTIKRVQDRRAKSDRIIQAFSGLASQGKFWVRPEHTEFKAGWESWDGVQDWDLGDAVAQAVALANPWLLESYDVDSEELQAEEEKEFPELVYDGGAP